MCNLKLERFGQVYNQAYDIDENEVRIDGVGLFPLRLDQLNYT